jgi:predicted RNA binding protein YcfA (HicA-like mRNA interferase family)
MTIEKLKKIEESIRSLRKQAGSVRDRDLVGIAEQLGRVRVKASGGHQNYISNLRPGRITIPSSPKPLKRLTTISILKELESDLFYWREKLNSTNQD